MKKKINLTIDEELIPPVKNYANKQGKSISQLVEELLTERLNKGKNEFVDKWLGKLNLVEKTDERMKFLKNRFQL